MTTLEEINAAYGRVLKRYREDKGLSLRAGAERCGVCDRHRLWHIENGRQITTKTALQMTSNLGIEYTVFLQDVVEELLKK